MDHRTSQNACGNQHLALHLLSLAATLLCIKLHVKRSTDIKIGKLSFVNQYNQSHYPDGRKKASKQIKEMPQKNAEGT